jgi:uncharacterized membrane protein YcaP (DUF421 family)
VSTLKLISLVLLVVLAATVVQPARAEAVEPMTAVAIAGIAIGVVIVIAVVVIANIRERQGTAGDPVVVAFKLEPVQGL